MKITTSTNSTEILSGKAALVTGGSRGIGASIAKRLAADGAAVAITYTSGQQKAEEMVRSIESVGGRALAIRADTSPVPRPDSSPAPAPPLMAVSLHD
jgi:3-oxoacyl-[acyl-carrier protein] reductase